MAINYTPDSISGTLTSSYVANELNKISIALQDAVSRSAETPNALTATLDVNSQQVINLVTPTTNSEPVTKGYGDGTYGNSAEAVQAAADAEQAALDAQAAQAAAEAVEGGLTGLISEHTVTVGNKADPITFTLNELQDKGYILEIVGQMDSTSAISFQINGITSASYNTEQSRFSVGASTHTAFNGATNWTGTHTGSINDDVYLQASFDNKGLEGLFKCEAYRKDATPVRTYAYGEGPVITLLSQLEIPGGLLKEDSVVRLYAKNSTFQPTAPIVPAEPYDVIVPIVGGVLGTTVPKTYFIMEAVRSFTISAGTHRGHAVTGPTGSDAVLTVYKNGVSIGTITFTTAGGNDQDATSSFGGSTSFVAGDLLTIDLTTADSNDVMENVSISLLADVD